MTRVDKRGPLFTGELAARVAAAVEEAKDAIADEGVNLMHASADVFQNPTGYWESQLQTDRAVDDRVIHDDVVYNAWLEGVSSRNAASRFKGYRIWRQSAQKLQDMAPEIGEQKLREAVS